MIRQGTMVLAMLLIAGACATPQPLPTVAVFNGACRGVGFDGHLTGDPSDPRLAWLVGDVGGDRRDVIWPPGYTARFTPRLEVLNEMGAVVLRDGDLVSGGCTTGPDAQGPLLVAPVPLSSASGITFTFDVENQSSVAVVVSVASDTAATMPGFEPGQRGTISILLRNPRNGIGIEIQGSECQLLAKGSYPTPGSFTLLVEDGAQAGTIELSTRAGAAETPLPLPSNALVGCGG